VTDDEIATPSSCLRETEGSFCRDRWQARPWAAWQEIHCVRKIPANGFRRDLHHGNGHQNPRRRLPAMSATA